MKRTEKHRGEWAIGTRVWVNWPPHYLHKATGRIQGYFDSMLGPWPGNEHYYIQLLDPKYRGPSCLSDFDENGVAFIPEWAISIVPPEMWNS